MKSLLLCCLVALAALVATATPAHARTEVREHATLRYGLGGDFAAHGFGNTGFIISEALWTAARWSLPDDIGMQGHPEHHWGDPLPQFNDLYLTGGSARPGIVPRRSWWSERYGLWFRLSVPRCLRVTLYLLDASPEFPFGPANVRFDAGTPDERLFHVEDARSGVYLSFNMTVGSANMTIEKTNGQTGFGALVAGVFFDELPAGSSCALSRPRTAPWTLEQGGATLLYNAGGYMSTLGFGGRAYWLPPADLTSAPVTSFPSAGYAIDVSRPYVVGSNIHMPSDDRLLTPPGSERRRSLNIQGEGGGDLTFTVTVPRCSLVRMYVIDLYDNIQEAEIRRPGKPTVRLGHGLLQGVWVTFTQETRTAQYITNKVSGPNLPLSAVAVDDGPADCVFVTPAPPPPPTPVPPPTPAPACAVRYTASGVVLRPGAGGNFRGEVGVGNRGWVLGGRWNVALPFTGYGVAFPQTIHSSYSTAPPAGYPIGRLLAPPGSEPWPEAWYALSGNGFDVVVTVPRCTLVTFYFLDYTDAARRFTLDQDGVRRVDYTCSFDEGVYVTVPQTTGAATYSIQRTAGWSIALSGVMFDDLDSSDCVFLPATSEPPANRNANGDKDGGGSNTVVIAVVAALAVGAICIAVAIGIVLAARRANNDNNNDNQNGNADDGAEMGPLQRDGDERGDVPVVGAVVGEPTAKPGGPAAGGGVLQCPEPQRDAPPPAYGYPPSTAHTPAHFGYPAAQPQPNYGYPPQPPVLDDGARGPAAAAGDSPDAVVVKTTP